MKATSAMTSQFYFKSVPTLADAGWQRIERQSVSRVEPIVSVESSDERARKHEIVCSAILGLCLVGSFVLCAVQLIFS